MQVARWGNSLAVRVAPDGAFLDTNVLICLL